MMSSRRSKLNTRLLWLTLLAGIIAVACITGSAPASSRKATSTQYNYWTGTANGLTGHASGLLVPRDLPTGCTTRALIRTVRTSRSSRTRMEAGLHTPLTRTTISAVAILFTYPRRRITGDRGAQETAQSRTSPARRRSHRRLKWSK